ncbi:hypothetical protein GCK32_022007, partial [Trichostrongylus colubriformis]
PCPIHHYGGIEWFCNLNNVERSSDAATSNQTTTTRTIDNRHASRGHDSIRRL